MNKILSGSHCVVIGATGNIGRGAAKAFLKHGAKVVVLVGRDRSKLSALASEYLEGDPRLQIVVGDITTPEGAQSLANTIKNDLDTIDHVVSSSGPWWNTGPLHNLDPIVWRSAVGASMDAHFFCFRYLCPLVARNGSFLIMNGGAADGLPETGLTGICAFSVRGLCKVLLSEGAAVGVRMYELLLRFRVADGPPNPGMKSEVFGEVFAAIAANKAPTPPDSTLVISSPDDVQSFTNRLSKME